MEDTWDGCLESSYPCSAWLTGLQARLQTGLGDRIQRADRGTRERTLVGDDHDFGAWGLQRMVDEGLGERGGSDFLTFEVELTVAVDADDERRGRRAFGASGCRRRS